MVSTIRIHCKPIPGTERICIKNNAGCVSLMKSMSNLYPDIKQIVIYRNCLETVSSFLALMNSNPYTIVGRILMDSDWFAFLKPFFKAHSEVELMRRTHETVTDYMFVFHDAMIHDKNIIPVKYEDLLSSRLQTFKSIFEKLGLDLKHLDTALNAFEKDSQRGTILSRSRIGNTSNYIISGKEKIEADVIISSFCLPCMGNDFRI